jgi:hypothetical protein
MMRGCGNGKRDRTPTPSRLRKIKRISFKAFLHLKGLFKDFKRDALKSQIGSRNLSHRAPTINDLETRIHVAPHKKNGISIHGDYEPTRIQNTRDCLFWQWRRVAEWHRYINDPVENINGHMTT